MVDLCLPDFSKSAKSGLFTRQTCIISFAMDSSSKENSHEANDQFGPQVAELVVN